MKMGIILNSGVEIKVTCEKMTWTYDPTTQRISEYSITGIKGAVPKFVAMSEIAAIIRY